MNTDVIHPEVIPATGSDTPAASPRASSGDVAPSQTILGHQTPSPAAHVPAIQVAPPHTGSPIPAFVGLLCLIIAVAIGLLVMQLHRTALAKAETELEGMTLILADQAERAFEAVDLLQTDLVERLKDEGVKTPEDFRNAMSGFTVHEDLSNRTHALSQLEAISAIDEDGNLINLSRYWPVPDVNVADRDYFKLLKASPEQSTFIAGPTSTRAAGTWTTQNIRTAVGPDGKFLGLIMGAIRLDYFEQRYQGLARGDGMALSLFRHDGVLLARHPAADSAIGAPFAASGVFARWKANPTAVLVTRQLGQIDHVDRLIVVRPLQHHPLDVSVSMPMSTVFAEWRRQASYLIGGATLLASMMAAVGMLMMRQVRAQHMLHDARAARAEAEAARRGVEADLDLAHERERATRELQTQNLRFQAALGNMTQGLGMFDASDALIVANPRLAEIFGLPPGSVVPGMTAPTILANVADWALRPEDLEEMRITFRRFKIDRKRVSSLQEVVGGRALAVTYVPVDDDGWLVTVEDVSERRTIEAKIAHMAHHDALTGLPNRVLFHDRLAEAVARSRRGQPCAVLFLDLDHFKAVNDTLGHPAGDALLREVTQRLTSQVRDVDTVARLGGDEFAIVQSSADQPTDATALAARLIETLSAPYDLAGNQVIIGTSIGIAVVPGDGDNPDQLLKNADMALYRAKADGRGRYCFFEPAMDAAMQGRRALELDLRKALAEGEFKVFYQPLMNVQTRSLTGFEALVRWFHPERGIVPPTEFIPLAEEIGLIVPLGEWVLRQACADASNWPGTPKVAVNLSPVQFASKTLVQDVASALASSGLDPARLELEITETVMLADTDAILVILHQLRDLGVGIAMDDFGTGYSSLSYLRRFPFSKVKIDRSFVEGMGRQADCDTIIEAVANLCKRLGMITTAEGVETDDQLARLAQGECTEAQGYLFSQPRPANEVADLCARLTRQALLQPAEM